MESFIDIINNFININVLLNGIYDIACSLAILFELKLDIARIHINTFDKENMSPFTKRLLSYWIMTYAFPRIFSCMCQNPILDILCAMTYFIEGTAFFLEFFYFKSAKKEIFYPILLSYLFGIILFLRSFYKFYSDKIWYIMFYYSDTLIFIVLVSLIIWIYSIKKAGDINSKNKLIVI